MSRSSLSKSTINGLSQPPPSAVHAGRATVLCIDFMPLDSTNITNAELHVELKWQVLGDQA